MIQDFKFALRQLLKSPGFTAVAVLTLSLAIGVNSAIFALINSVVLHPMVPLRPQEVVNVFNCRQNANHDYRQFSYNEYRELRENSADVFVDLAALEFAVAGIGRDHEMRRSFAFLTSENYFSLIGVQPFCGRFYNAEECKPNANIAVVVASYGFWKRQGRSQRFCRQYAPNQWPALHRYRHYARSIQRRERVDCARYLGAARHSFAARLRLWRFRDDARPGESKKLCAESRRPNVARLNYRDREVAAAGLVATVQCHASD